MRIVLEDIPGSPEALEAFLEGMTALNTGIIRGSGLPPLFEAGVVYRREPRGREQWLHAAQLVRRGFGDCEDLACYRAADLRVYESEPARVRVLRTGRKTLHAVVERADGSIEDVARALGMGESDG